MSRIRGKPHFRRNNRRFVNESLSFDYGFQRRDDTAPGCSADYERKLQQNLYDLTNTCQSEFFEMHYSDLIRQVQPSPKLLPLEEITVPPIADLITSTDPVPERAPPKAPKIFTTKSLDLGVFKHEKCSKDAHQELLDSASSCRKLSKLDAFPTIEDEFLVLVDKDTVKSCVTIVKAGLVSTFLAKRSEERDRDYRRVLFRSDHMTVDEVRKLVLMNNILSLQGLRKLNALESSVAGCGYELNFAQSECGATLCKKDSRAKKYPIELDAVGFEEKKLFVDLRWSPYPHKHTATIWVNNCDLQRAIEVLSKNQLISQCKIPQQYVLLNDEIRPILVHFNEKPHYDTSSYYPIRSTEDYEHAVRTILEINGMALQKIKFDRRRLENISDEEIIFKINHRIGRCLVNSNNWDDRKPPCYEMEWRKHFNKYPDLPWTVSLKPYNDHDIDVDRYAQVEFKNFQRGLDTIEYISKHANNDFLQMHSKDRHGTLFTSRYRHQIHVPPEIRVIFDEELRALDERIRNKSDMSLNKTWARLRDLPNNMLAVEGWDQHFVEEEANKLKELLKGEDFDCSADERGQLLVGCGLQYVNALHKKFHTKAFFTIDRLNEKISIIGEKLIAAEVKQCLLDFVKDPHNYHVQGTIVIDLPRYLPVMKSILDYNGEKRLCEYLGGGCEVQFRRPNKLHFAGTVHQYNQLNLLLDNTHFDILERFSQKLLEAETAKERFIGVSCCPVCTNPYSYDKYRISCGHAYCLHCLIRQIKFAMTSGELPLNCAKKRCAQRISTKDILSLLYDERSIQYRDFFAEKLTPLLKPANKYSTKADNLRPCIRPGCEGLIAPPLVTEMSSTEYMTDPFCGIERVACPVCRTARCTKCPNPPHVNTTCEEEALLRGNDEKSVEAYLRGRESQVKKCPICQILIQKEQGCNHMHCSSCKIHFCWVCLFYAETQQMIYKHMQDEHGGTGGEWQGLMEEMEEADRMPRPLIVHRMLEQYHAENALLGGPNRMIDPVLNMLLESDDDQDDDDFW